MGESYFIFNGKKSTDFGLLIDPDFQLIGPEKDIERFEVPGVDGDTVVSNERFKGVTRSIHCYVEQQSGKSLAELASEISNWLNSATGWQILELSDSPNFIYRVLHIEEFQISKTVLNYSRAIITFRWKPYKFYKSGLNEITLTNGQQLNNIGKRPSKPLIKLTGSGNMTLTYGGKTIQFQSIQDGIIIDVLADTVVSLNGLRPEWNKVYTYPFPKIPVGQTTLSWTGALSVSIIPRWEALLP